MACILRSSRVTISGRGLLHPGGKTHPPVRLISTKLVKVEDSSKPPPWPYETKKYRWYHSILNIDNTFWRFDENTKVIFIEGNIGAGKTTLAQNLADQLGMKYFPEASLEKDVYPYLFSYNLKDYNDRLQGTAKHFDVEDFYKDPKNWKVAEFQFMKYIARCNQYNVALLHLFSTGQGVILERSCFSDFVFVDAMTKMGYMSRPARRHYYDVKTNTIMDYMRPHCVIYLDAPVDVCYDRVMKRNIPYEVNSPAMNKEYLKEIERGYKNHYLKQMEPYVEMIVYDWTKPADADIVAEDLEKIDFDKDRVYFDPKFRDWRNQTLHSEWDELRIKYTNWDTEDRWNHFLPPDRHGAVELYVTPDDNFEWEQLEKEIEAKQSKYYRRPDDWWGRFKQIFAF
ncbi:NADH dehydrogenase [ubiquinone] 1 alpha subcomplex subunit 10, mitochondrial-like [Paramacrobiotus metropolitanus]|uniref:NADH dehydrogenase [ubiquinone] 1 alpha subcomplex subunit 10, mitochondrial-like n=1 Tax=Paramacrobiotus metropolitanus TaxID=2943436 RepID=UPI00244630DC|nr:NADH dehydrogenase [ubiquinone] 1 alpha subcomplex subunit 10, mitochondrial-like [Paramacrobiotus metropolitanus]